MRVTPVPQQPLKPPVRRAPYTAGETRTRAFGAALSGGAGGESSKIAADAARCGSGRPAVGGGSPGLDTKGGACLGNESIEWRLAHRTWPRYARWTSGLKADMAQQPRPCPAPRGRAREKAQAGSPMAQRRRRKRTIPCRGSLSFCSGNENTYALSSTPPGARKTWRAVGSPIGRRLWPEPPPRAS